jgi:hypothetical protein
MKKKNTIILAIIAVNISIEYIYAVFHKAQVSA